MPEISRFYGIVIKLYFGDHNPDLLGTWYTQEFRKLPPLE